MSANVSWRLAALGVALTAGCGGEQNALIDIAGTVAYQGKPVPGGTIMLQPASGKTVVAPIDDQGRYHASVAGGSYRVAVVSSTTIPDDVDPWKTTVKFPPPVVPDKYGRPETSGQSIAVGPDSRTIDISLP